MERIAVFTDASRLEDEEGVVRAAYGWVAVDLHSETSPLMECFVDWVPENYSHSTVHGEVMAIHSAVQAFPQAKEVAVFTDSLYSVVQLPKMQDPAHLLRRPVRVFPEVFQELSKHPNLTLHHVQAHRAYFYNEMADQMVRGMTRGVFTPEEAQGWAREAHRRGVIEIVISRNMKPKYVQRKHERNRLLITTALATS